MRTFTGRRRPSVSRALLGATIAGATVAGAMVGGPEVLADQVIPDDLIVQGSLCVGFDCVANMNFGFDTIVLRENNLRIFFDDTSSIAGYPANDWRLIANDSAAGGSSLFAIEDATAGRRPVTVEAGAASNSIYVDTGTRIGFGTSTPVLLMHGLNGNTPALRLEQDGSGGWSPYTWDIGANETNFFVRDVTAGSRLPLRIRPGAPTSSLDIAADGDVGIGTASPGARLHVSSTANADVFATFGPSATSANADGFNIGYSGASFGAGTAFLNAHSAAGNAGRLVLMTDAVVRMTIAGTGNVGIGTTTPAAQLHTTGGVRLAGVANCSAGVQTNASGDLSCLASSRQFKSVAGDLSADAALANVMALRPRIGAYTETPDVPEHWLIAEDVAAVDAALAGFRDGRPYTVKTQNVVADLVAVVQHQQREIEALKRAVGR